MPKHAPPTFTTLGLVLTIVKCFIGSGILFLPKAFSNGGYLFSTLSMVLCAALTQVCVSKLIACRGLLPPGTSYGAIGQHVAGFWGARAVDASLVLSQAGFCIVYVSFIARNVIQLLNDSARGCWVGPEWIGALILAEFLVLAPLTWVRRLASFEVTNIIADGCIAVGLLAVLAWAGAGMARAGGGGGGGGGGSPLPAIGSNWALMLGTAVYAFEGAGMVVPMVNALPPAGRAAFPRIFALTLAGVSALYIVVGLVPYAYIVGYGGGGGLVQDTITLNLPKAWWSYCVLGGYCVALALSYPLMMFPAMRALEAGAAPFLFPEAAGAGEAAEAEADGGAGGGGGSDAEEEEEGSGGGGGGGGEGLEEELLLRPVAGQPEGGEGGVLLVDGPSALAAAHALLRRRAAARQSTATMWKVNAFRSAVVGVTLLVAYGGASQLDNMVSLIGAFCCTPIAFIFPAWFHAVMVARPTGRRWAEAADWAIVALGCAILAFSSYMAVTSWSRTVFNACLP